MKKIVDWIKSLFEKKVIRYLFTGGILFLIDTAVYLTLKNLLHLDVKVAQWISRSIGATIGFVGHKFFVFKDDDVRYLTLTWQGVIYVGLVILNVFLSGWLLDGIYNLFGLQRTLLVHDFIAKVMNEVVMVTETYIVLNIIFKKRNRDGQEKEEEGSKPTDHSTSD